MGLFMLSGRHVWPLLKSELDMRCYDCLQEARSDTAGIGVCSRCGLATCENHARVRQVHVTRQIGMGSSHGRIPARRVVCHTCDTAETAQ
ncbi:hypothetical protein CA983_24665 [Streptomyces swartbergensis]|uniref:DUF2180 domain-containing protein n=2 Tax=Streptomyces swartbergensis TaxID=487165 RepID=A0A243RZH3_9ACTN|nr:hypothetical protein CA983_24665 [Streptomyces swartbergensis]